jgi:hypothetical protein
MVEIESIGIIAPGSSRKQIVMYSRSNVCTDYIATEDKETEKKYIFEITSIETINEKLQDIEYYRIMLKEDNYSKYNVFRIEARFIGALLHGRIVNDLYYIASPGTEIFSATDEDIKNIFDINESVDRIKIGRLLSQNSITVNLDFRQLFAAHASILGRTGSGKTYFIEKLLNRIKTKFIVISSTNEYNSLVNTDRLFDYGKMPIDTHINKCKRALNLNDSEMAYLKQYYEMNTIEDSISSSELSGNIYSFFSEFSARRNQPELGFAGNMYKKNNEVPRYVLTLCDKLAQVSIRISKNRKNIFNDLPVVFNTQELPEKTENIAVYSVLSTMLNSRISEFRGSDKKPDDVLIILEEAHNYAPSVKTTICKDIIIQIARAGRKYGLHLLVLSQRPRYIDQTLLSQCGTNFIFNLPNPHDVEYIMEHSYFYNENSRNLIQNLKQGVCLITSNARSTDIVCRISSAL